MTNYNYNGLNAHDIANKIIEKEERYLSIDFDTLSFEDKCRYAAHHNGIYHPLFRNGRSIEELKTEIMPEIIRRSEAGDSNAMFYLCIFHPDVAHRSEEHKAMVERAMKMGSYEAKIYYAGWFCREDNEKAYELLDEVLTLYSLGDVTAADEKNLYDCYCMLAHVGQRSDEREEYKRLVDELALKFVLDGEYHSLTHLCVKNHCPKDPVTKQYVFDDETVFWKTVSFLVESYFYDKWSRYSSDNLGIWLIRGIGCDPDFERAKQFYLDVYFRKQFDRSKMLELLDITDDSEEAFEATKLRFNAELLDGNVDGYWKMILLAILQNDRASVEQLCDDAIEKYSDDLMKIIHKAYTKLLTVRAE